MEIEAATGKKAGRFQALAALRHRNFRLFWSGQLISLIGTWMQNMAQGWLVLQLTNSPFLLGLVSAIQLRPCWSWPWLPEWWPTGYPKGAC